MNEKRGFLPPNTEEIIEILNVVSESDFEELRLEMGEFKLVFSKRATESNEQAAGPVPREIQGSASGGISAAVEARELKTGKYSPHENETPEAEVQAASPIEEEGLVPVKSPLLGIFYRSPKPGAPPFVEIGTEVTEDDTVCFVEVMKLFNTVKADLKGRIVKICAENNQMVEYGQTLFLIEPS